MIRKIWEILSPFHRVFTVFLAIIFVYEGMQIIEGYTISFVVRLFTEKVSLQIWLLFGLVLIVYDELFMRLDNHLDWHIIARQAYPVFKHLKTTAIAKLMELDVPWHKRHHSGTLVGKISQGTAKISDIIDAMSWEFIPTIMQTVLSLIPLLILTPATAAVAAIAFSGFFVLTVKANEERTPKREARHDLYDEEWLKSVEMVQSIETATMFDQRERLIAEQRRLHQNIMDLGVEEARIGVYKYNRWRVRILSLARRLVLAGWIVQIFTGTMDVPSLIFANVLTEKLFHSFWRFARLFDRAAEASEGAERLADLMTQTPTIADGHLEPEIVPPVSLKMAQVCFAYEKDYSKKEGTIHNLDLDIEGGQIIALVGPSGSGKTTIRKLFTRLEDVQSGEIEIAGFDIKLLKEKVLRRLFSYVPQGDDVHIFSTSIKENIAFARKEASLSQINEAARLAGVDLFIASLPEGLDTLVGERGKRLSGGQKQRVALARAILANRPILILDEATSSVDAITEVEIQTKMRDILKGKTAIIIAHRLATVWNIADKIVVLDQGRKIEEGTHEKLVALGGLYARMVSLQTTEN